MRNYNLIYLPGESTTACPAGGETPAARSATAGETPAARSAPAGETPAGEGSAAGSAPARTASETPAADDKRAGGNGRRRGSEGDGEWRQGQGHQCRGQGRVLILEQCLDQAHQLCALYWLCGLRQPACYDYCETSSRLCVLDSIQ